MQCHVKVTANTKSLLLSLCYRRLCLGTIVFLPQEEIPAEQESAMQSDCTSLKVCLGSSKPVKSPSKQRRLGTVHNTDPTLVCLGQWNAHSVCMVKCIAKRCIVLVGSFEN